MAFDLSFEDAHGVTHATAYARVTRCWPSYEDRTAVFILAIYATQTARNNGKLRVGEYRYAVSMDGVRGPNGFNASTSFDDLFATANVNPVDRNPAKNIYDEVKVGSPNFPEWDSATDNI